MRGAGAKAEAPAPELCPGETVAQRETWAASRRRLQTNTYPCHPLPRLLLEDLHCGEDIQGQTVNPTPGRQHWPEELQLPGLEFWAHLPAG